MRSNAPVLATLSDGQLVASCRAGDQAAWGELVERFSRYVYAIATQVYRLPEADAEDVFQETFARTFTNLDRLRDDDALRPWIGQLTRRLCVDELRRRARVEPTAKDFDMPAVDMELERLEEALCVHEALLRLPEPCREVVDRFFCRDESYATISGALAIPPGTIASRISRCLVKLRETYPGRNG
jgi:RNA polymerase sigma factor (sigma-70 family)